MDRRDISKALFAVTAASGAQAIVQKAEAQTCTAPCYSQTSAEAAAGVTPTNYAYPPGDIRRYGNNTSPGSTDMSSALVSALSSNPSVYLPSAGGTYYFGQSSSFSLSANQTLFGDGAGSLCTFGFGGGNNLVASGVSGVTIRDLRIVVSGSGSSTYIGAVAFISGASECLAENLDISGVSGCGVLLQQASSCTVKRCYFHSFNTANNDTGDVFLTSNSTAGCQYCIIEDNQCFGGGWHGIAVETQGAEQPCVYNVIKGNRIGQHAAYGILNYSGGSNADTFTQIIGNHIQDIQGAVITGNSGAGIYSVAAGGVVISNNTIQNCCVQTTSQTLVPGGIGVEVPSGLSPVTITGNMVTGMTRYNGIYVASSVANVSVVGNSVLMPGNNTSGSGIQVANSSNVTVTGNTVNSISAQPAILCNASSGNLANLVVGNNVVTHGGGGPGIEFTVNSPYIFSQCIVGNNTISTTASGANILVQSLTASAIQGNSCYTAGNVSLQLTSSQQVRMTCNVLQASGTYAFTTSGTCTSSLLDDSNFLSSAGSGLGLAAVYNAGTGCNARQLGTFAPTVGTHVLGDTVYNTAGATPFAWTCTAAGTPGTFTGLTLP